MTVDLRLGDCLDILPTMEENSIDTAILDPPGGIAFMGKKWDNKTGYIPRTEKGERALELAVLLGLEPWEAGFLAFMSDAMQATFRVLKPGAMALVWGIPRTSDLTSLALRVAGFEVRDTVYHLFGSGFPKSANLGKMIDKAAGAEREVVGSVRNPKGLCAPETQLRSGYRPSYTRTSSETLPITAPATPAAQLWDGYGTALKPAVEEWILAMKPRDGTFANNALVHGVAGLAIDACRVGTSETLARHNRERENNGYAGGPWKTGTFGTGDANGGRWPANLVLSHSPGCRRVGVRKVPSNERKRKGIAGRPKFNGKYNNGELYDNTADQTSADPDGLETIPAYDCVPGCAVRMLGESSGERVTGSRNGNGSETAFFGSGGHDVSQSWRGDKGTAARFFQQFEGEEWECAEDCAVAALDRDSGESTSPSKPVTRGVSPLFGIGAEGLGVGYGDTGGASRFFQRFTYQPKASRRSRELGLLGHIPCVKCGGLDSVTHVNPKTGKEEKCHRNGHPTVKSLELMRWLCRLTKTPTGGVIIDPFMGSGRTGMAAVLEGRSFIGIEQERASFDIAEAGIRWTQEQAPEMVQPAMPGMAQVTKL